MTGALLSIDIRGRDGVSLRDRWADGPHLSRADGRWLPNLHHHRTGQPVGVEQHGHLDRAARGLARTASRTCASAASIASNRRRSPRSSGASTSTRSRTSPSSHANSWYVGANIPGSRGCSCSTSAASPHRQRCDEIVASGYQAIRAHKVRRGGQPLSMYRDARAVSPVRCYGPPVDGTESRILPMDAWTHLSGRRHLDGGRAGHTGLPLAVASTRLTGLRFASASGRPVRDPCPPAREPAGWTSTHSGLQVTSTSCRPPRWRRQSRHSSRGRCAEVAHRDAEHVLVDEIVAGVVGSQGWPPSRTPSG